RLTDLLAPGIRRLRIIIIGADEISGEPSVIVDVGFSVRHRDWIPELLQLWFSSGGNQRFEIAGKQFIFCGVVFRRLSVWQAIRGISRVTKAIVVGLDGTIALASFASLHGLNEWQQTAAGCAWPYVRIGWHCKLMFRRLSANAIESFAIFGICLSPELVSN